MQSSSEMVSGCLVLQGGTNSMWMWRDVTYIQTFCYRFFYDDLPTQHTLSNTQIIKTSTVHVVVYSWFCQWQQLFKTPTVKKSFGMLNIFCHCHLHYTRHHCQRITSHLKHFMLKQFLYAGRYCCTKSFRHFLYKEYSFSADDIMQSGKFHLCKSLTVCDLPPPPFFLNICQHHLCLDPLHINDAFQELLLWSVVTLLLHTCVTGALWHKIFILKFKFVASLHNKWFTYALFCKSHFQCHHFTVHWFLKLNNLKEL